jgi:hypothetical protein
MIKKISSIIFSLLFISSCASTHGSFVTEHENAWIDGHNIKSSFADKGLLYCMANVKKEGRLADPVCYETRFEEYEDEKPRVDSESRAKKVETFKVSDEKKSEKDKSEKEGNN